MKPHIICHMAVSIDGRTLLSRWKPAGARQSDLFDQLHERLAGDAWLIGRATGQEYAKRDSYPTATDERFPREPWFARRDAKAWGIAIDATGKIAWGRDNIGDDPILVILTEAVSDAHLAGLRADGVSYIFAGETQVDLARALDILARDLGIERLLIEGGGTINGAFLRAGLIDELSTMVFPAIDGRPGAPSLFDAPDADVDAAPLAAMTLSHCETLDGGVVWLRYALQSAGATS